MSVNVLDLATRAQMSLLWSYRGKVDWKTKLLKKFDHAPVVLLDHA